MALEQHHVTMPSTQLPPLPAVALPGHQLTRLQEET